MPRRPDGPTLALGLALPVEAATTLALPAALAGAVDAVLAGAGRSATGAFALLALTVGTAAAANATAAAAGPAGAADATAALRGRLVRHLLDLGPGGRLRGGPPP
ncbi:hypothetical protein ACFVU9_22325, partial [Kitasatospora sp. NPDC057936]